MMHRSIRYKIYNNFVKHSGWKNELYFLDSDDNEQRYYSKIAALEILDDISKHPNIAPSVIVIAYRDKMEYFYTKAKTIKSRIMFYIMSSTADQILDLL